MKKETLKDIDNPEYMFSLTPTALLLQANKGEINIDRLVKQNLMWRGVDQNGKWVGPEAAKKIWS